MYYAQLSSIKICLLLLACSVESGRSPRPLEVQWSNITYGPDGPWYAVKVWVGSQKTQLDLIPGAAWWTDTLSSNFCDDIGGKCYARQAGLYAPLDSTTHFDTQVDLSPPNFAGALTMSGNASAWMDSLSFSKTDESQTVRNCTLLVANRAVVEYPNKQSHPVRIGQLSLGGNNARMGVFGKDYTGNMPPGRLHRIGTIPSPSFGLHIGSTAAKIPGSLVFGGYDQNRIVGTPISVPLAKLVPIFRIEMLDIDVTSTPGITETSLMSKYFPSSGGSLPLGIASGSPYITLPLGLCHAMTANLPVTLSNGYYLWNTTNPIYERLVNSASYYTFSIGNGVDQPVKIRIPFKLLDLTLEPPVVDKPTKYFPCYGTSDSEKWGLGQAFIQATFYGVNWGPSTNNVYETPYLHLAQAPGPDLLPSKIRRTETTVQALRQYVSGPHPDWVESWKAHWNDLVPLPGASPDPAPSHVPTQQASGLPVAAQAGIGVGVTVLVLLCIGLAVFFVIRQRRRRRAQKHVVADHKSTDDSSSPSTSIAEVDGAATSKTYEKDAMDRRLELEDQGPPPELDDNDGPLAELDDNDGPLPELDGVACAGYDTKS